MLAVWILDCSVQEKFPHFVIFKTTYDVYLFVIAPDRAGPSIGRALPAPWGD